MMNDALRILQCVTPVAFTCCPTLSTDALRLVLYVMRDLFQFSLSSPTSQHQNIDPEQVRNNFVSAVSRKIITGLFRS